MLSDGQEIGNYIVEAELARGGMACLYRVRHRVLGTVHALKVLDPDLRVSQELRSRFLSEALIGARLRHPGIVRVTDTVSTPEVAGLVMDLIRGPTLEGYIARLKEPPSGDTVRELFLPVLEAVGEAHRAGIVHRDIKPSNILLEEADGGGYVPKVSDFGIAKITAEAKELSHNKAATNVAARMGTPAYMSPEQIRGAKEVTPRSDIFSLGATLYELSTLKMAFDGETEFAVMERIVHARFAPPEQLGVTDGSLAAAITRALSPNPEDRFATCAEFADALTAPPPLPSKTKKKVAAKSPQAAPQRSRAGLYALIVLVLLACGAGGVVAFAIQNGYELAPVWPPRKKRARPVETMVSETWSAKPPFTECVVYNAPARIVLTRATARKPFRDATELRYWFRNLPTAAIDVYLEDGADFGRSVVFELVTARWPRYSEVVGSAAGAEVCFRLGLALVEADAGRPMSDRYNAKRSALEYEMLDARRGASGLRTEERLGTLDDALRPTAVQRMQAWVHKR